MKVISLPENVWRIEAVGQDLQLSLVRDFMGKRRVLKATTIAGFLAAAEPEKRSKLISALGKEAKWSRVFLSLPRDQGIVRQLQLPVDVENDLRSVLALQIEAISAWPEPEVFWDYTAEKVRQNPNVLQITLVVIPKPVLDQWLMLFQSVGVSLSGATLKDLDGNVIPASLRRRSARAQAIASYVLVAAIVLLGIAFLVRNPYQQRVFGAQIQREISRLEPQVKDLVHQEADLDALTKRYRALDQRRNDRDWNLDALKTLATALPPDTFVLNYRYQSEIVTLSGISTSALDVQSALEKSPTFKDVQFAAPITREASGKDRFALKMAIEAKP